MGFYEHGAVLIVDDNEIVREIVRTVAKKIGFKRILEAENGNDAWSEIQKAQAKGINLRLIVSDVDMPEMNGIEFLNKVRSTEEAAGLPFILLTAHAEKEIVMEAMEMGVTGYLTKPFAMNSIEKKIRETLAACNKMSAVG
jgi:two-component system chemotaxis response regulator CheY